MFDSIRGRWCWRFPGYCIIKDRRLGHADVALRNRCGRARAESPVPAEQSLQVMKILDGIYRRQKAGCEVRLD